MEEILVMISLKWHFSMCIHLQISRKESKYNNNDYYNHNDENFKTFFLAFSSIPLKLRN